MGRVNLKDLDKYSTSSSKKGKFFKLEDDGDTANVRFMIEDAEDLNDYLYAVHKITIKKKFAGYMNCLREYNDPVDVCPMCAAQDKSVVRMFLPVYDTAEDEVKLWDRSNSFARKITGLCSRYNPLVNHKFDVVRNGEAGDQKTTYDIFETDKDDIELDDLPEIPEIEGLAVLNKSEDEMEYYIENGEFPDADDEDVKPRRKKKSADVEEDDADDEDEEETPRRREKRSREERSERRTPAKSRRSKEDKF